MSLTAIAFVLVYFFGLYKAISSRPLYGLYTYFYAFYAHPPGQWWGADLPDLRWSLTAGVVTFISLLINKENTKHEWLQYTETKVFAAFVLYTVLQLFWASSHDFQVDYIALAVKFLFLFFLIQGAVRTDQDVFGFLIVNLIGCAYFGYQGFGDSGRLENLGTAGIDGSNHLAQHMATVLVFSSVLLLGRVDRRKLLLVPLIVLVLNGVLMCESRSSTIALFASGAFILLFSPAVIRKKLYFFLVLGFCAFTLLIGPSLVKKFSTIKADEEGIVEQDKSAESRKVIVQAQWQMFLDNPLFGYGHRGTFILSPYYLGEEYLAGGIEAGGRRASHNITMSMLVDHGLIGASLYFFIVFLCIAKIFSLRKLLRGAPTVERLDYVLVGLAAALVCLMVAGQGSNNKKLEIDIWLFAMIPLVYGMLARRHAAPEVYSEQETESEAGREG